MVKFFREPSPRFASLLVVPSHQQQQQQDDTTPVTHRHSAPAADILRDSLANQQETLEGFQQTNTKHPHRLPLKNVYQQPLPDATDFKPPVFQHSALERKLILAALQQNFVFSVMSEAELEPLVSAFASVSYQAGATIIKQGDPGDFFYVLVSGRVIFQVNGVPVGEADTSTKSGYSDADGDDASSYSFGELALLYTCPRAATVTAGTDETHLFRVDHRTFRYILQAQTIKSEQEKSALLRGVSFLEHLTVTDLQKLSSAMTPRVFSANETLVRKGDAGDSFYVIKEGTVVCTDICAGNSSYQDVVLTASDYFGEYSIIKNEPRVANVVSRTKGVAFTIDRECFSTVLGDMSTLILRGQDSRKLCGVNFFQKLTPGHRMALADMIVDQHWSAGDTIVCKGELCTAALYIVRQGELRILCNGEEDRDDTVVGADGYLGEQLLDLAAAAETSDDSSAQVPAPFTVTATQDCVCGVLTWHSVLHVLLALAGTTAEPHTARPGTGVKPHEQYTIQLENVQRHMILGQGTFGQCWLVSVGSEGSGDDSPYALKIQSKAELIREGQAEAVLREKNIMQKVKHPFIIQLVTTFHDSSFIYMLLEFVQGGELFSVLHQQDRMTDGLPDAHAKFYALCVASALAELHRPPNRFVYRDLKPENVMIDREGYPKLIDFGFCKSVPEKTFTLCGTPGYLSPEIIMTRGHSCSTDHWSLGILIHELVTGYNPFFEEDMDQMALFQRIVTDDVAIAEFVTPKAYDIIDKLLVKDPTRRLGSLARGECDILEHPWFDGMDRQALLRRELQAPWVPHISDPFDTTCFDDWGDLEDKTKQNFPALSKKDALIFAEF